MNIKTLKPLEQWLPEGQLVNRVWLADHGFKRPKVDYFLRSGRLEAVAHGVYRRPGPPLKWEHLVYSLNEMGYAVHVGGRSGLELQGYAHYLPVGSTLRIDLFGDLKLPTWVPKFKTDYEFEFHGRRLFRALPEAAIMKKPFGSWDWPIPYATPELCFFEMLAGLKTSVDFSVADKFFEAAANLRPNLLKSLLLSCTQVKAKRLFLWLSDRHGHDWRANLNRSDINLGSGKRMIIKGGAYDTTYQITVPKEMASGSEPTLY